MYTEAEIQDFAEVYPQVRAYTRKPNKELYITNKIEEIAERADKLLTPREVAYTTDANINNFLEAIFYENNIISKHYYKAIYNRQYITKSATIETSNEVEETEGGDILPTKQAESAFKEVHKWLGTFEAGIINDILNTSPITPY